MEAERRFEVTPQGGAGRTVIALVPDAFGGRGGIAHYNRNFLKAICADTTVATVLVVPRAIYYPVEELPEKLDYLTQASRGRVAYIGAVASLLTCHNQADLIVCGHLHLLPIARLLQFRYRCRILQLIYGIEAWHPTSHVLSNLACRELDGFVSIRKYTAELFISWAKPKNRRYDYLPNCIDPEQFNPGPKRPDLVELYGLLDKKVVISAGRLDNIPSELNKGFEEVLAAMPQILAKVPNLKYLIVGDGADKPRLEALAASLGLREHVTFTGYVSEAEKADHYRLGDVFALPGSNPLFDTYPFRFVFLEAAACGLPIVGPRLKCPLEANDPDVRDLIIQVDPTDTSDIARGILHALQDSDRDVRVIEKFYYQQFQAKTHTILSKYWSWPLVPNACLSWIHRGASRPRPKI